VGFLFKQNLKTDNRNELLIFITPRVLKDSLTLRQ
jgi:type IV pilus assembly protein PilQ